MLPRHHVRVNALIVRNGHILLVKFDDRGLVHFNLPGGGVEPEETAHSAVIREVREETGADVAVGPLAFVVEWQPAVVGPAAPGHPHVRLIFHSQLLGSTEPAMPLQPDSQQIGVEWVRLDRLDQVPLLQPRIAQSLSRALSQQDGIDRYILGDERPTDDTVRRVPGGP